MSQGANPHVRQTATAPESGDFPSIQIPPKAAPSNPASHPSQLFQPAEVPSPDALLQTDVHQQEFAHALFSALDFIPDLPYDLDDYAPMNPIDTPKSFPQMPNMRLLQPEFFRRFDAPTLFYIFFYFTGTPQQFFAGRELKERGWRFHTKYQTWFRRLAEPVEITHDYELGKVEFFDHREPESWGIKQRNGFKFEYKYLETE
jgi:CCR4-NOT transcription complex subunit 3